MKIRIQTNWLSGTYLGGGGDKQAATAVKPHTPPKPDIQETREGVKKNKSRPPSEENSNGEGIKIKMDKVRGEPIPSNDPLLCHFPR